jgi:crotonobetaine/carnitine-CoA ligase
VSAPMSEGDAQRMTARLPAREEIVLRDLLERRAAEAPEATFAIFQRTGERWTHRQTLLLTRRYAAGLQALGVRRGELVVSWLPNGPHAVLLYLALTYLGAVYVPINTSYKGNLLEHVIRNAGARLIIADHRLAPRLTGIPRGALETLVVVGTELVEIPGLKMLPEVSLTANESTLLPLERPIEPWESQSVIYTSGTTGPSKGVVSSYAHYWFSVLSDERAPGERMMLVGPMFHTSGAAAVYGSLFWRGSFVMLEAFSTKTFWRDVAQFDITYGLLLGAMTTFLLKEPPSPADRAHRLRKVIMLPLSDDASQFTERFGVDVITMYNMTETSTPLVSEVNPRTRGTCGRLRPAYEARIVDANDNELPDGVVGELILRTALPWTLCSSYHGNSEATAQVWRNGWLHTGDAMKRDVQGNFFFVDRLKDSIRRRGENISSFEVEKELLASPLIRDVAVVAVTSEYSEDEVLAALTLVPGAALDYPQLVEFLEKRLPHFMIPRYFRVLEQLPMTPTNKVEKYVLRGQGVTADTWDREAAGFIFKRERLATDRILGES